MATRTAAVQLPLGQLAVLGMGAFCVMNPDKFFTLLHRTTQAMLLPHPQQQGSHQQPIVIHQSLPTSGNSKATTVVQLVIGAGFCWGTYVVLVSMLPEQFRGMLPVSTTTFNRAISSLGKAVINLKDTLMEQVSMLSKKQDDLSEQQEETHVEVLNVKESCNDLKQDLTLIQESLNLCHSTLSESDRRTAYIAHGVQLLTRGVSTFLPEDDSLLKDLLRFNNAGEDFKNPAQLVQLRTLLRNLEKDKTGDRVQQAVLLTPERSDPENEVPGAHNKNSAVEQSVVEVRDLLARCGVVM
jgi:hypothetical protein